MSGGVRLPGLAARARRAWELAAFAACLLLALPASSAVVEVTLPFGIYDDAIERAAGTPLALTPSTTLVPAEGSDETAPSADDVVLLIRGLGGNALRTPLATPFLANDSAGLVRLSATRAVALGAGADGAFGSDDDVVQLLDRLGTLDLVTPIPVGALKNGEGSLAVPLGPGAIALRSVGADGEAQTEDDALVVVTGLGAADGVTPLPAPWSTFSTRLAALSPTALLAPSAGDDGVAGTEDDAVYLFTDLGGANVRTPLPTPYLAPDRAGTPVRLAANRALIGSCGPDGVLGTSDDALYLLDDLGGANALTPIAVPNLLPQGAGGALALDESRAVVATAGADGDVGTDDDSLVVLSDLGGSDHASEVVVGPLVADAAARPVPLAADAVALSGAGPDGAQNSGDDRVLVVSDLAGAHAVTPIPIPGLSASTAGAVVPLGADALLVEAGGNDGELGAGGDDELLVVSGIGSVPTFQGLAAGSFDRLAAAQAPQVLGDGRAVQLGGGDDDDLGAGGDDVLRVVGELPRARDLAVAKLSIAFNSVKGANVRVKGTLALDGARGLEGLDVTLSVGSAAQAIPAAALVRHGSVVKYQQRQGFVRKLRFDERTGRLVIRAHGTGAELEDTEPGDVPVALEFGGQYLAQRVVGEAVRGGIRYKAPRGAPQSP